MSFLFAGIIAAAIAAFAELTAVSFTDTAAITLPLLLLFATIEELLKFGLLMRITVAAREHLSFPVRTGLFAIGFGATEILLAARKFPDAGIAALAGIFLVHLATIFLYGLILEKRPPRKLLLATSVMLGIAVHFAYNTLI